jgi:uncharacterized protein (DUF4415 family)
VAKKGSTIVIEADPADPDDFPIRRRWPKRRSQNDARGGRPKGSLSSDRQQITLRVPKGVIDHFRAAGAGRRTRMIERLEREAKPSA